MAVSSNYTIYKTKDGSAAFSIPAATANGPIYVNPTTDLTFYGYGYTGWGEEVDRNFYRLLENFACPNKSGQSSIPKSKNDIGIADPNISAGINKPVVGQLWFNTTSSELFVCINSTNNTWKHLLSATSADSTYLKTSVAATTYLPLSGGTLTGDLTLPNAPTLSAHATTKAYVDSLVAGGGLDPTLYITKDNDQTKHAILTIQNTGTYQPFISFNTTRTFPDTTSHPTIQIGQHDQSATTKSYILFHTGINSGVVTTGPSCMIEASGGTVTNSSSGTIKFYGITQNSYTPSNNEDLTNKLYVDNTTTTKINNLKTDIANTYVRLIGDTMSGVLDMGNNKITTSSVPTNPTDVANKQYVDSVTIPIGGIIMWSGSINNIPPHFSLCDGATYNGHLTPNLSGRFVIGPDATNFFVGDSGGYKDAIVVEHTHNYEDAYYSESWGPVGPSGQPGSRTGADSDNKLWTRSMITESTGQSGTNQNLPPYYVLAYIMRTS